MSSAHYWPLDDGFLGGILLSYLVECWSDSMSVDGLADRDCVWEGNHVILQIARSDGMDTQTSTSETVEGDLRVQTIISDLRTPCTTNRTNYAHSTAHAYYFHNSLVWTRVLTKPRCLTTRLDLVFPATLPSGIFHAAEKEGTKEGK